MSRSWAGCSLETGSPPVNVLCIPGLAAPRGAGENDEVTLLLEFVLGGSEECAFEKVG